MNKIANLGFNKEAAVPEFKMSPSSIKTIQDNPMDWYMQKIKKIKLFEQTIPMAVGSAFDDEIKRWLWKEFKGQDIPEGKAGSSIELKGSDRDEALRIGKEIFNFYKNSGALTWLVQEIEMRDKEHKFGIVMEDWAEGLLDLGDGIMLPLCGKPDLAFWLQCQKLFVLDWKCNGIMSSRTTSPKKGYTVCRDKNGHLSRYKEYLPGEYCGIQYNKLYKIEDVSEEWAFQILCYNWLLKGKTTGDYKIKVEEIVGGIDQILGPGCSRISSFRGQVGEDFQKKKIAELKLLVLGWDKMIEDCEAQYNAMAITVKGDGTLSDKDAWLNQVMRG